jgi:hypothetical protein
MLDAVIAMLLGQELFHLFVSLRVLIVGCLCIGIASPRNLFNFICLFVFNIRKMNGRVVASERRLYVKWLITLTAYFFPWAKGSRTDLIPLSQVSRFESDQWS